MNFLKGNNTSSEWYIFFRTIRFLLYLFTFPIYCERDSLTKKDAAIPVNFHYYEKFLEVNLIAESSLNHSVHYSSFQLEKSCKYSSRDELYEMTEDEL